MAVKTSKLNSKLPVASNIRWYVPTTGKRYRSVVTNESRRFSFKLCFDQPSSKNSKNVTWQIKYRFYYRYTPSVAKAKGLKKQDTKWSTWRTPYERKYRGSNGKTPTTAYKAGATVPDPKYWLSGNRSYVTSSSRNVFLNWYDDKAKYMNANYDCIVYEFAIRSYHKNTAKHGSWRTQQLKVFRRATVKDEVLIRTSGGGLQIDFNYIDDRGGTVSITSIKDSSGTDILKSDVKVAPTTDSTRASSGDLDWYAYKRSGYTAGQVTVKGSNMTRYPKFGETLTVTAKYVNTYNVETLFEFKESGYVYGEDTLNQIPKPKLDVNLNKDTGVVTVKAYKNDQFDGSYGVALSSIACTAEYTLDDHTTKLDNMSETVEDMTKTTLPDLLGTWKFRVPLNKEVKFYVSVSNELGQKAGQYRYETFEGKGCRLNGHTNPDIIVAIPYNTSLSMSTSKDCMIELPHGRDLPFAVFGTGRASTLSLKGNVVSKTDRQVSIYETPYHIKQLAKNLGIYWLRTSKGEIFKVAVKNVDWDYGSIDDIDVYSVTIDMEEVS